MTNNCCVCSRWRVIPWPRSRDNGGLNGSKMAAVCPVASAATTKFLFGSYVFFTLQKKTRSSSLRVFCLFIIANQRLSKKPFALSNSALRIPPSAAPRFVLWLSATNFTSNTLHLRRRPITHAIPFSVSRSRRGCGRFSSWRTTIG